MAFSIGRTATSRRTPPRHGSSPSTIVCHLSSNGLTFDDDNDNDDDNDDNDNDEQPQRAYKTFDAYDEMSMAANYNPQDDDYAMSSSFADEQVQDQDQGQEVFEAPASTTKNKVVEEPTRQVSSYNNNNNYYNSNSNYRQEAEEEEDEPLCPLSQISSIAEPTHLKAYTSAASQRRIPPPPPPSADTDTDTNAVAARRSTMDWSEPSAQVVNAAASAAARRSTMDRSEPSAQVVSEEEVEEEEAPDTIEDASSSSVADVDGSSASAFLPPPSPLPLPPPPSSVHANTNAVVERPSQFFSSRRRDYGTSSPMSPEEWRAKFAFTDEEDTNLSPSSSPAMLRDERTTVNKNKNKNGTAQNDGLVQSQDERVAPAAPRPPPPVQSFSNRREDQMYELECTMTRLQEEIFVMNNGKKFNLSSFQQVSIVLFGTPDESTSKSVLDGMAASNILAKLILEHRQAKQYHSKLVKQQTLQPQKVQSVTRPTRAATTTTSAAASQTSNMIVNNNNNDDDSLSAAILDSDPLLLVDTSSFLYRAYYSMPPMHRADGLPVAAVLGVCNMFNRLVLNPLLRGEQPRLVLCCDASGPTWRKDLYPDYKAQRPEAPMDLIPQFALVKQAAAAYGMTWIECRGYEADDVIATLSQQAFQQGLTVDILSGDKDLMQLITTTEATTTANDDDDDDDDDESSSSNARVGGGRIEMIDPLTMTKVTHDTVVEKWGVPATQLGDILALAGDAADNIPGVPGIGPKIAAKLLEEFGTLEHLLANTDQVPQKKRRENLETYQDQARLSQQLVALSMDIEWDRLEMDPPPASTTDVSDLRMEPMDADRILAFYDEMGFFTIKQRLLQRLEQQERISYQQRPKVESSKRKGTFSKPPQTNIPQPEDYKDVPF
jgi:5'-3' exonuclease